MLNGGRRRFNDVRVGGCCIPKKDADGGLGSMSRSYFCWAKLFHLDLGCSESSLHCATK
jgi:hypothetical protein